MLRVRFHGRGGHGIKTASRILGTAAFLSRFQVQDAPIYGAERRGAPIAAYTRIDVEPIQERGIVPDPDLILIADETLLRDPAGGVLVGRQYASVVFINSPRDGSSFATEYSIGCPVVTEDLTAVTAKVIGRGSALSAALGAVATALAEINRDDVLARAVRAELGSIFLPPELIEKNVEVAKEVCKGVSAVRLRGRPAATAIPPLHTPVHLPGAEGVPIIASPGNAVKRHTGSWRIVRPAIDCTACTHCRLCLTLCPDAAIHLDEHGAPVVDYGNCKGCMICGHECPVHCIHEEKEVRAW